MLCDNQIMECRIARRQHTGVKSKRKRRSLFSLSFTFLIIIITVNILGYQSLAPLKNNISPIAAPYPSTLKTDPDPVNIDKQTQRGQQIGISSTFLRYLKWHQSMKVCTKNDTCGGRKPNFILWRCKEGVAANCWGTGDRMRGIISSLVLAMLTEKVFLIDWPGYPFQFENVIVPSSIDWTVPESLDSSTWPSANDHSWPLLRWEKCLPDLNCVKSVEAFSKSNEGHKPMSILKRMNFTDSQTYLDLKRIGSFVIYSRSLNSFRARLLHRREWAQQFYDFNPSMYSPFQINRVLLKALFRPSKIVEEKLNQVLPMSIRRKGYISIHARTGHDVGEGSLHRFSKLPSSPDLLAARLIECSEGSGLKQTNAIFFAADSVSVKKSFIRLASTRKFNIFSTDESAMHVADEDFVRNQSTRTETRTRGIRHGKEWGQFINIFVEFFGLAGGKSMIATRSEFSRLAFLIGDSRRPRRVDLSCRMCSC